MQAAFREFLGPEYSKIVKHQKLFKRCINSPFFDRAGFAEELGVENSKEAILRLVFQPEQEVDFQKIKANLCKIFGFRIIGVSPPSQVVEETRTVSADVVFSEVSGIPEDNSLSLMSLSSTSVHECEKERLILHSFARLENEI